MRLGLVEHHNFLVMRNPLGLESNHTILLSVDSENCTDEHIISLSIPKKSAYSCYENGSSQLLLSKDINDDIEVDTDGEVVSDDDPLLEINKEDQNVIADDEIDMDENVSFIDDDDITEDDNGINVEINEDDKN